MNNVEKEFKLADYVKPALEEGKYTIRGGQTVTSPQNDSFSVSRDFYVSVTDTSIDPSDIFSVYPAPEQRGDFTGTLPFIVLTNRVYPWLRHWTKDRGSLPVPWLAVIVVADDEGASETDIPRARLKTLREDGVFFPYHESAASIGKDDDPVHILTISAELYRAVMPDTEDLPYLAHAKFVNLSATEDAVCEKDGWFSTLIANRFVPSSVLSGDQRKSAIHVVAVDGYLDAALPKNCVSVRFVSLYHWNVYSETADEKSFVALTEGLKDNSAAVQPYSLKPHYLRTGEKTYSLYHSPLLPYHSQRYDEINGSNRFSADGRLVYHAASGIFDASYAAAFNLGRLITLSRRAEAEKIAAWRRKTRTERHESALTTAVGFDRFDVAELCAKLSEGGLV